MVKLLVFVALCALLVWLFLRPQPGLPTVAAPAGTGLSGFEQRVISAGATHSNTWKRWIIALAAFTLGYTTNWFLSGV